MSTYTSAHAHATATLIRQQAKADRQARRAALTQIVNGLDATYLTALAGPLASPQLNGPGSFQLIGQQLNALPDTKAFSPSLGSQLDALQTSFHKLSAKSAQEQSAWAGLAAPELARLSLQGAAEFSVAERLAESAGLAASLQDLGYWITESADEHTSAIEASRGHEKVLVVVENGGSVQSEWLGLRDSSCLDRQRELEQAARQHGVDLGQTAHTPHHDPRGGQLIAEAARHSQKSLAEGAVLAAAAKTATGPAAGSATQAAAQATAQPDGSHAWANSSKSALYHKTGAAARSERI